VPLSRPVSLPVPLPELEHPSFARLQRATPLGLTLFHSFFSPFFSHAFPVLPLFTTFRAPWSFALFCCLFFFFFPPCVADSAGSFFGRRYPPTLFSYPPHFFLGGFNFVRPLAPPCQIGLFSGLFFHPVVLLLASSHLALPNGTLLSGRSANASLSFFFLCLDLWSGIQEVLPLFVFSSPSPLRP